MIQPEFASRCAACFDIIVRMKTDSFFWHLFKELPETLFALLGLPERQAAAYQFDAVELKKTHRLDGLFVPKRANLPLYFVEVQFHREASFYANLFAKVFLYLEANNPSQDWHAVALFASRSIEPKELKPYRALLESTQVHRLYVDELSIADSDVPGLQVLQLLQAPESKDAELLPGILDRVKREPDCDRQKAIIQLIEELAAASS
jgi:predicted transposase/invertase (TIGR01784 family)